MGRIITPSNTQQVRHLHLLRDQVLPHQTRQWGATAFHPIRTQHTTHHARTPRVDSMHQATVHPQHARGYRSHTTHQLRGDPLRTRETHASGNTHESKRLGNRECPALKERVRPDERFWKVATTAAQAVNSHYERTKKRLQVGMRRKIITLNNHGDEDIIQDGIYRIYHGWNGLPRHQNWN